MSANVGVLVSNLTPRALAPKIAEDLEVFGAVAVMGPRTVGKSTLAREIARSTGGSFLDLDDPRRVDAARAEPAVFVAGLPEPIVIDEFQHAPEILAAIKAQLNVDYRPGRFLLTGSAHHQAVPELASYLAGRLSLRTLLPFAEAELGDSGVNVVDVLLGSGVESLRRDGARYDRRSLAELVLRGGFPLAVPLPAGARARWLQSLAVTAVERIEDDVRSLRRPDVVVRMLHAAAARTAQILNAADLGRDLGLGRDQAGEYLSLLEAVHLVHRLPAWSTNFAARVTKSPKLHVVDSGLAGALLGIDTARLEPTEVHGSKMFGQLLETFVVNEVRKQASWAQETTALYHARTSEGLEVDLVIETPDGRVVGIEVKAGARFDPRDARHLRTLRDRLGSRFVGGLVLNTGPVAQRVEDRIAVAPVEVLWS